MAIREAVERVFTPQSTKVWHKLALVAATLVLPITALNWLLSSAYREQIGFTKRELVGADYLKPLGQLAEHVVQHRSLAAAVLSGDAGAKRELQAKQEQVEADMRAAGAADQALGGVLGVQERWASVKAAWDELRKAPAGQAAEQSLEQHNQLAAEVLGLMGAIDEASNLRFDPVATSYYLGDAIANQVPAEADLLGQIRDQAVAVSAKKDASPEDRARLLVLLGRREPYRRALDANMKTAFQLDPQLETQLRAATADFLAASDSLADLAGRGASGEGEPAPAQELADAGNRAVVAAFKLYDDAAPALKALLNGRIKAARSSIIFGVQCSIAGLLLTLLVGLKVSSTITAQIQSIQGLFGQIGIGNYQARAQVVSFDELGELADSLNTMLDNTLVLVQSRAERDSIQASIVKLLEEVSGVAEGDLTREAEVTEDVTGAIADSFNYMINQLRRIISDVQDATLQVGTSANEIHAVTERLVHGSETQAEQIIGTSAAIEEMALSIQQVSENADDSATVAQQALSNATQGSEAVQNTIQGMNRIRDQAQETAKRIKRLGESSQEIGQIIQLIDDIADRTSILALNASIQAAAAGEAGRGFAVVAEEVERLAERSTDATKKIATLIKTIQSETNEAVSSMEKSIHEVVEGSKLANQAGHALEEIESVSNRLAQLIQSISMASKQQATSSEAVAKSMGNISHITQQTAGGTRQAANAVSVLAGLAEALRNSVSTFRLPSRDWEVEAPPLPNGTNGHGSEAPAYLEAGSRTGSGEFRRMPVHA